MVHTINQNVTAPDIRGSLSTYLANRNGSRMVTMADAIGHVRKTFPGLGASDSRLTDMIAGQAIILGLGVELDRGWARTTRLDRWTAANDRPRV